ncbi:MAG: LLM class flavin-dependent oxidoreductase, partial [Dehalococcoidia bacterium]
IVRLRSPIVMAETLVSLDELTGGRMILSPGACTNSHARRYGLEPMDPGLTLTEWVEAIRLLITGEKVTFEGKVANFKDVEIGWKPARKHIPLWIPSTSRTGLRITGKIGDGVLLNATCSPEYSANAIKILREAVKEAGKDWESFVVAQLINCSVEDDHERALDAIRWEVASKFDPLQIPFIAGPKMRVGEPYIKKEDIPRFEEAYAQGGKAALMKALPNSYVEGMTASGTPEEVVKRVQQYRDVGVQLPILRPAARHQTQWIIDLFAPA